MSDELLKVGDPLSSVQATTFHMSAWVGRDGCEAITVDRLPGPMGLYLVAVVKRHGRTDQIVPLHTSEGIQVFHEGQDHEPF